MTRNLSLTLAVLLFTLTASPAWAEPRVTVHDFYGPNGARLRGQVASILERQEDLTVVPEEEVERAARRLNVDPYSPEGRKALARELQLSAWLTGAIKESGRKLTLTVVVYDGAEHARVGRTVLTGHSVSSLKRAVKKDLWRKSKDALFLALAPLPAGRAPIDAKTAAAEGSSSERKVSPYMPRPKTLTAVSSAPRVAADVHDDRMLAPSMRKGDRSDTMRAMIGFGSPYRSLAYSDAISSSLGDYQLGGAPMLDLAAEYYPGRHFTQGWASWLGLDMAGQMAFATSTTDRNGNKYKSRYDAYRIGLKGRIPVGRHFLHAFSGYSVSQLSIKSETSGIQPPTPNVDYRMIRSGAGAEFALTDSFALGTDFAWLYILSVGEIAQWFPRTTAGGLELSMNATYAISPRFFARATAVYQRTFFDFHSRPSDERVAGGATDQVLRMSVGAGMSL